MKRWRVKRAKPEHIPCIAENMRESDRREVWASNRRTPLEALTLSLQHAELAFTAFIDGVPALMWGVGAPAGLLSVVGVPWFLGTDAIREVIRDFLKYSPRFVQMMQDRFPRLENHVHARNRLSIRWLTHCGFTLDSEPTEINGEAFFKFWRERHE